MPQVELQQDRNKQEDDDRRSPRADNDTSSNASGFQSPHQPFPTILFSSGTKTLEMGKTTSTLSNFRSRRGRTNDNVDAGVSGDARNDDETMTKFERFISGETPPSARWLGCACTAFMVLVILCSGGFMFKMDMSFGWLVKGDPLTQAFFAHLKVRDGLDYFAVDKDGQGKNDEIMVKQRTIPTLQAQFIYEAVGNHCPEKFTGKECDLKATSVLDVDKIEKIRKFEVKIWNDKNYLEKYCALVNPAAGTSCLPPMSLLQRLYNDNNAGESAGFEAAAGSNVAAAKWKHIFRNLCNESDPVQVSMRDAMLPSFACEGEGGDDIHVLKYGTPFLRTGFFFGAPLKQDQSSNELDWEEEIEYLTEEYGSDFLKVFAEAAAEANDDKDEFVALMAPQTFAFGKFAEETSYADMYFVILSFVLVFLYMWFTVESLFISMMGMIQVVGSVFPSVLIWSIFNPKGVQFMQLLAVFMILGIGADDVFVLNDAWQQAKAALLEEGKNEGAASVSRIFRFAYRRAFSAMLATTATTSLAFLFGIMNAVPAIRDFCIFAAIIVICDFLFCITFFAASVAFFERYMKGKKFCCGGGDAEPGKCCQPGCCFGGVRILWTRVAKASGKKSSSDDRFLERFFRGSLFDFINRFKVPLVVLWILVLAGASISAGIGVRPQSVRSPNFHDPYHQLQRGQDISSEYFALSTKPKVIVSFGFDNEQPIEKWDPTSEATFPEAEKVAYGGIGSAISQSGQQKILDFCRGAVHKRCSSTSCPVSGRKGDCETHISNGVNILKDSTCQTGVYCIMEQVKDFADLHGESFPVSDLSATLSSKEFKDYLAGFFKESAHWTRGAYIEGTGVVFDGPQIKYMWVSFNGTYAGEFLPYTVGREVLDDFEEYATQYIDGTNYIITSIMLAFTMLQEVLIKEAFKGIGISLAVAAVTLALTTFNWYLAILGTCNILFIMILFLGLWPAIGWSIDIYNVIFLIMSVGLAVDYTVHLLHAFNESAEKDRTERVRSSLGSMGITVLSGALTTLLAALPLFFTQSQFFFNFGLFVFIIISLSIVLAILLLIPVLLLFGPKGTFGDIHILYVLTGKCGGKGDDNIAITKEGARQTEPTSDKDGTA
jgi:preprotein translocase subunit SecF